MNIKIFSQISLVGMFLLFLAGCGGEQKPEKTTKGPAKYYCPMHPTYTSDRPGDCPICNMKLVPLKEEGKATTDMKESEGNAMPGRVAVHITPEKQQMIGVSTSPVEKRELVRVIHATGVVEHDETRLAKIAPRFGGWVRELKVNYIGQHVHRGDPLFTVYSPELFSTEREYLLAFAQTKQMKDASPEARASAARLLEGAKKRLELWEISDEEIHAMEASGKPNDALVFRSPVTGHVTAKTAVEGKAFMAGETLYEIADLTHLWVNASIFESDIPDIKVGLPAKVIFPPLRNKTFESKIAFIYPHIDPVSRRAETRIELENSEHQLQPDMWADVEIEVKRPDALTIPASAVIDTGVRYVAFVNSGEGHFEPRDVKIGTKTDDYYEVTSGLEEKEEVVTRALFLVDSESQLKAAITGMGGQGEHKH